MTNRPSKLIACPKCMVGRLNLATRGNDARGVCPTCGFRTGWVPVPGYRVPRHYLAERCLRIRRAYLMVRGQVAP